MRLRRRVVACSLGLALVTLAGDALAGDALAEDRVASVQATLDADEPAAMRWWALWSAGFAVSGIANGVGAFVVEDPADRASARVNTVASGIALVGTLLTPMPGKSAGSRLRAFRGAPAEREREAERLLAESVEAENFGRSWLAHAGALVVNAGAAAWLTFHDGYPWRGLLAFVTGEIIGEVKIFTMPTGARDATRRRASVGLIGGPVAGGVFVGVAGAF